MLANRLFREPIEPPRLRVGLNLAIPGIVEIDFAQTLEKLGLSRSGSFLTASMISLTVLMWPI